MHEKKTKLKIVLTSSKTNAASYIQYKQNLNEINLDSDNTDIILDISNDPKNVQYNLYDIALFMGYDEASKIAKQQNHSILTGIIDPRASFKNNFKFTDFVIANGLESKDYFSQYMEQVFVYHTFPIVNPVFKELVGYCLIIFGFIQILPFVFNYI